MTRTERTELQTDQLRRETGASKVTCRVLRHCTKTRQRLVILSAHIKGSTLPQSVAYTFLRTEKWPKGIWQIDTLLQDGALMGETFRSHGFTVYQNRLFRARLPHCNKRIAQLYKCTLFCLVEVECYEFWADSNLYGTVLEIKTPQRHQAPARRCLGAHCVLKLLGTKTPAFDAWLTGSKPIPWHYRPQVALAQLWGLLTTALLYIRTHVYYSKHSVE